MVVDSIAFHLRHAEMSYAKRLQTVGAMAQALVSLALSRSLAAVAINQVTTKVNDAASVSSLVPALGESQAHITPLRLTRSSAQPGTPGPAPPPQPPRASNAAARRLW